MHPMLQLTMLSGIAAVAAAVGLPIVPRKTRRWLLLAILLVMCYLTLLRSGSQTHEINLTPFWSYHKWNAADVRWQIYMNVFLFIPYGAVLKSLDIKRPVLTAIGTSVAIELLQYAFCLGLCELDDVTNNTIGALIGCALFFASNKVIGKVKSSLICRRE